MAKTRARAKMAKIKDTTRTTMVETIGILTLGASQVMVKVGTHRIHGGITTIQTRDGIPAATLGPASKTILEGTKVAKEDGVVKIREAKDGTILQVTTPHPSHGEIPIRGTTRMAIVMVANGEIHIRKEVATGALRKEAVAMRDQLHIARMLLKLQASSCSLLLMVS